MRALDWIQLGFFLGVLTLLTRPLGAYLFQVLTPQAKTPLDILFKRLEMWTYRLCGISAEEEHTWTQYLRGVFVFSAVSLGVTYLGLACQHLLPLNPEKLGAISSDLNFNTSVSFMTNTNWQSYPGETTLSYLSQMGSLTLQNFVSAAVGLAVAAAFARGIARHSSKTLGNFWVDLVRITYYVLLPIAFVVAILLLSQGVPQNFDPYAQVHTVESSEVQTIVQGPIASQEAIKMLGTNGGGYTEANSAHPYENPTPFSNWIQILCILLIPAAQTYYYGREVKNQKHGWCLYTAMLILFVVGVSACTYFERRGTPWMNSLGVEAVSGNMEGKETRFGIFGSTLFASATTCASNGAVNSAHDSYTPLGGMIPLLNMQLGEIVWGGVGSGLYSILIFVILAVFIAGLVIGRTPEYLGKKIEAFDVKVAIFSFMPFVLAILGFTAWACISMWGTNALKNPGAHGFTEILYAYSSATANNGSSFNGLATNTPWWNVTLGVAMLLGRFLVITPVLALAGSLCHKKHLSQGPGSFPVTGVTFTLLIICVIILIGALSFLPALIMGPFMEQFLMNSSKLF